MGKFWGGGGFSERSPSSPDPFSRRAAGVWRVCFCMVGSACEVEAVSCELVEVTAADRAAAPCKVRLRARKELSSVSLRLTAPSAEGTFWLVRPCVRSPTQAGRGGSVSRRDHNQFAGNRTPPLRRNQFSRNNHLKRQPLFGRGGLGERRFSQRSGLSPRALHPTSLRKGARGRGFL